MTRTDTTFSLSLSLPFFLTLSLSFSSPSPSPSLFLFPLPPSLPLIHTHTHTTHTDYITSPEETSPRVAVSGRAGPRCWCLPQTRSSASVSRGTVREDQGRKGGRGRERERGGGAERTRSTRETSVDMWMYLSVVSNKVQEMSCKSFGILHSE